MDIPITVHDNKNEDKDSDKPQREHEHGNDKHAHEENGQAGNASNRTGLIVVVLLVIAAGIWLASRNQSLQSPLGKNADKEPAMSETAMKMKDASPESDALAIDIQNDWIANIAGIEYSNTGALADVSGGTASGQVGVDLITGVYHLYATFNDLPALEEGFFYEGWVVRKDPLSIVSTGPLVMHNGQYVNAYLSRTDLLDHVTYVLTLEPDDGDPAPAAHVLDGTITPNK